MKKLWLDDLRPAPDKTWDVVKNYPEFVEYITNKGVPDFISFDHDLGSEGYKSFITDKKKHILEEFDYPNGYDCVKFLVKYDYEIKGFDCHSANPIGKANILNMLNNWKDFCYERNSKK